MNLLDEINIFFDESSGLHGNQILDFLLVDPVVFASIIDNEQIDINGIFISRNYFFALIKREPFSEYIMEQEHDSNLYINTLYLVKLYENIGFNVSNSPFDSFDINDELFDSIISEIPDLFKQDLLQYILSIYIVLCEKFSYDPFYFITKDRTVMHFDPNRISRLNCYELIDCHEFVLIMRAFCKRLSIQSKIDNINYRSVGNEYNNNSHWVLEVLVDNIRFIFDSTYSVINSDLGHAKTGQILDGIFLLDEKIGKFPFLTMIEDSVRDKMNEVYIYFAEMYHFDMFSFFDDLDRETQINELLTFIRNLDGELTDYLSLLCKFSKKISDIEIEFVKKEDILYVALKDDSLGCCYVVRPKNDIIILDFDDLDLNFSLV